VPLEVLRPGKADSEPVTQAPSIIVWVDGGTAYAKDGRTGKIIAESSDHASVIQAAINALEEGGKLLIRRGVYNVGTITGKSGIAIEGEACGRMDDPGAGTVLKYTGASGGAVLDFTGARWFQIRNVKIDGSNKLAGAGIACGSQTLDTRTKDALVENVSIFHCRTGLKLGGEGWSGNTEDSEFRHLFIAHCDVGIDYAHTMNNFFACTVASCGVGYRARPAAMSNFHGCVFSGNGIDIEYVGDSFVNVHNFFGCWFEAATTSIIKRPTQPALGKACGDILFSGCHFAVGSGAESLMDFRNIIANIHIIGGRVAGGLTTYAVIFDSDPGTKAQIRGVENGRQLTFSGSRTGFAPLTLTLQRCQPGAYITCNSGASYAGLDSSDVWLDAEPSDVVKAEAIYIWNPNTTAGGIELYAATAGLEFGKSEPGAAGWRTDVIDVTSAVRSLTQGERIIIRTKGNGATAPQLSLAILRLHV